METKQIIVHGYMKYKCRNCGRQWKMYLEKGIEEGGKNHKPSPFVIGCRCGGLAEDVSGIVKLSGYLPIPDHLSYFANREDKNQGVPVLRGEDSWR